MKTTTGRAAAYRKTQGEEVMLPSGNSAILRRPPIQVWLSNGRVPQAITAGAMDAARTPEEKERISAEVMQRIVDSSAEEQRKTLRFMVDVVTFAFVSPRIVEGGTGDDELDPAELEEVDFNYVFAWATRSLPEMPVGEGATVESVETFRESGQREPSADAGGNLPEVPNAAPI